MTQREDILKELSELQSSIGAAGHPGYKVPGGYFEGFAADMLKRIKAMEAATPGEELESLSRLLNSLPKKTPYTVPGDYFTSLSENLIKVGAVESDTTGQEPISSVLSGLNHKTTYTVPAGYFEDLPARILQGVKHSDREAKVVSINNSRKWLRYAAAAVVVAFVSLLGFFMFGKNEVDPETKSIVWVEKNLKKVSTDDISEFVELATSEKPDLTKMDGRDDIKDLLLDVSDKEIQDFLTETALLDNGNSDELIWN